MYPGIEHEFNLNHAKQYTVQVDPYKHERMEQEINDGVESREGGRRYIAHVGV